MLIALTLLTPLVLVTVIAGAGLLSPGPRHTLRRAASIGAPLVVLPAVLLAVLGDGTHLDVDWMLFGSRFAVDDIGRSLMLIAGLLYGAALMSVSWLKLRDTERGSGALSAFLLSCYAGNIGVYLAADAVTFYLAFAVLSLSAAGLVVHHRTAAAHRATRIYLVMSVLSETSILAAVLLVVHAGGADLAQAPAAVGAAPNAAWIIGLLLFGFGVKAGTFPLHVWLPLAHPAAPPAASAVLSGAMVKAGLVGWLRFLPLGEVSDDGLLAPASEIGGWVLLGLSLVGAFLAVGLGVLQRDPKVVLAYSTISQMGFLGAVVAVGLLDPELATATAAAAVLYAVHHGLAKGALFLGVPVVRHYGRGAVGVVVTVGMAGAALTVAGAPFTSGAFGKYVSKDVAEGLVLLGTVDLSHVLPLVATGSTLLLLRFGWVLWQDETVPRRTPDGELVSWLLVCAAGIAVPWLVGGRWTPLEIPDWDAEVLWGAIWPIVLGLAIGAGVWWLEHRHRVPRWAPRADGRDAVPGDLVVLPERLYDGMVHRGGAVLETLHRGTGSLTGAWSGAWSRAGTAAGAWVHRLETWLRPWRSSGAAVLLVLGAAVVLVAVQLLLRGWPQ